MSQHDIEELVESSIRLLHAHDAEIDHRSAFCALWKFQERFDCGFTHFRVMPLLLERRATYRFTPDVHPAVETVEGMPRDYGYLDDTFLYCDAGTLLWSQFVNEHLIIGDDAKPPSDLPLSTLALRIGLAAEKAGDVDTIAGWFNFGPRTLLGSHFTKQARAGEVIGVDAFGDKLIATKDGAVERTFTADEAATLPEALALRELARRTGAMNVDVEHAPPEWRGPLLTWWFG